MPGATRKGRRLTVRLSENNRIVHRLPALSRIKFTFRPRRRPFATLFPFLRVTAPPRDAADARLRTNTPSLPPLSHISISIPATMSSSLSALASLAASLSVSCSVFRLFASLLFFSRIFLYTLLALLLCLCLFVSRFLFRFLSIFLCLLLLRLTPLLTLSLCRLLFASLAFNSRTSFSVR